MPVRAINFAALPTANTGMPDFMQSFAGGAAAAAVPQQLQQQDQQRALANAMMQNQLQYQPLMNDAQLAQSNAGTNLTQQQAQYYGPDVMSQIGLRGAQTNLTGQQSQYYGPDTQSQIAARNMQTSLMPIDTLVKGIQASQSMDRFGGSYQLAKALGSMDPASRFTWIANNQARYSQMLTDLGNKSQNISPLADLLSSTLINKFGNGQQQQGGPQNNMPQLLQASQQGQGMQQLPQSPAAQAALLSAYGQPQQSPSGQQIPPKTPFLPLNNDQVQQLQLAANLSANKSLITSQTRRQLEGAVQVTGMMNSPDFQAKALNAAQYAGAIGKGQAAIAALSQQNPQAYEDYISFKNQDLVLLENRIKTLDQMGATDSQREQLQGMLSKTADSMTSNPKQFIIQLNQLGQALDNVGHAVAKSASPLTQDPRVGSFNPIGSSTPVTSPAVSVTPQQTQAAPTLRYDNPQYQQWANEALSAGANPAQVDARIKQMMSAKK